MPVKSLLTVATVALALLLPAGALADVGHLTQPGESLTSIAAADGLSVAQLAGANHLAPSADLQVGQMVEIPPRDQTGDAVSPASPATVPSSATASLSTAPASTATATSASSTSGAAAGSYVVRRGDTLSAIAARVGTTPACLAALNGMSLDGVLVAGRSLVLPGGAAATGAAQGSQPATGPGNQQIAGDTTGGPYPTAERVSAGQVGEEASAGGVDPGLAEAIGYQESGWNNDLVSSAGAVGVMQIEPATWAWINQVLTPRDQLSPSSAVDNVAGGVDLLHDLVAQTGSETEATAAYYQGLASLREHGMYASTQQYVRDVQALQARFGG